MMEDLDFRLLQGIAQSSFVAISYSSKYDDKLFLDPTANVIAKPMLDYVKGYHASPSLRPLLDLNKNNTDLCEKLNLFYSKINSNKYNEADYKFDIEKLKERFCLFKYKELKRINTESTDVQSGVRYIQSILNEIKGLNHSQGANRKSLKDYTPDFIAEYKAKQKNPELGQGILTGYSYLDFLKNGFRPADLIMIAGESGAGKSMWLNNIAINMWMQKNTIDTPINEYTQGYNVIYVSLEMPLGDMYQRTIASIADVSSYGVRDAKNSAEEGVALGKATKFFKNYPYTFDIIDVPRGFTVEQLELQMEQIKTQYKPDVVFIDYLGLMDEVDDQEDWLKLGYLAGKIHEFARIYEIPVITAVQMTDKRSVKSKEKEDKIG